MFGHNLVLFKSTKERSIPINMSFCYIWKSRQQPNALFSSTFVLLDITLLSGHSAITCNTHKQKVFQIASDGRVNYGLHFRTVKHMSIYVSSVRRCEVLPC